MKTILSTLFMFLISAALYAQSGFNYQSIVRNASGAPQADINVYLRFSVLESASGGQLIYRETQTVRTDSYGWLNATVGNGTPVSGTFSSINWASGSKFLSVECADGPNGTYNEIATSQINNSIFTGPAGPQGQAGAPGPQGLQGSPGPQGAQGQTGPQGPAGPQGPQGPAGTGVNIVGTVPSAASLNPNYNGSIGDMFIAQNNGTGYVWGGSSWTAVGQIQGPAGPQGPQGATGSQGPAGTQGPQGATGPAGPAGPAGPMGLAGPAGQTGPAGPAGQTGPAGPAGPTGPVGPAGQNGPAGPAGPTGPVGPAGQNGAAGPAGPTGPVGPAGPTGPVGPAGPANSLMVGTVTSSNYNSGLSASVTITGTSPSQTVNFNLESGPQGPQGNPGPAGPTGPVGPAGQTGPAGPAGPTGPVGPAGSYTAGTGINISGSTLSATNTSPIWNANQLLSSPVVYSNPVVNQILKYQQNGTWGLGSDNDSNPWSGVPGGISYNNVNILNRKVELNGSNTYVDGNSGLRFQANASTFATLNNGEFLIQAYLHPNTHAAYDVGNTVRRWLTVFTVNGVNTSSDRRLKKDILPIQKGLEKIMSMKPVSYMWKNEKIDKRSHLGFIAQDLEKVLPEVVTVPQDKSDSSEDRYGVNYSEIIPVLVKAIQEQQALILELKSEISQLKKEK